MAERFFNADQSFEQIETHLWHEFGKALQIKEHPFRWPTLATFGQEGPEQRTMVLRESDSQAKELLFYTDAASDKTVQLLNQSRAGVHAYDADYGVQVRLLGSVKIVERGPRWEKHWSKVPKERYHEYCIQPAPGEALPDGLPEQYTFHLAQAEQRFRLLAFKVSRMEALQLDGAHHLRLSFWYQNEAWRAEWLAP